MLDNKKVKLMAIKMKNLALFGGRVSRNKSVTWDKMKKALKRKYFPNNYRQDVSLRIHNLRQMP